MTFTLWHHPRCSKSRQTLALLESKSIEFELRLYLEDTPTRAELALLHTKLNKPVIEWTRTKDDDFKSSSLSKESTDDELLDLILNHPRLLERPILEGPTEAAIGRPPENVLSIL